MVTKKIIDCLSKMSLEQKADFCSGENFWFLKSNKELGIPQVMVSDGPNGVRKQEAKADHLGIEKSVEAVCFPAGCLSASSFDPQITEMLGDSLGKECQHFNIAAILGPSVNIKRSPLGGRNFEYYSEDPLVTSKMAIGFINGVQKNHIGTSLKHFLANNQENRRMTSSSNIDERTLHEIYLASFEDTIKQAQPKTVMSSYNQVNGEYVGDSTYFLTDVLRKAWGFKGMVISDWGGVNDRVKSLRAGLDLEMPGTGNVTTKQIIDAIADGTLKQEKLDSAVSRILSFIFEYQEHHNDTVKLDLEHDSLVAQKIAEESIILLKNDNKILPLTQNQKITFIGQYAKKPRYQGGGSAHINSFKVISALEAAQNAGWNIEYAEGFNDEKTDEIDSEELINKAVKAATKTEVAVIFAGLPDSFESEGYDRTKMQLPDYQNKLIEAVTKVQPNTIVILHNGSPVEMPWNKNVKGILETYLGGQAVGQAVFNILSGTVNPSGKLAETFPIRLEDNPSYLFYGGEGDKVDYQEGVFVGYRYYSSKNQKVLFPFGHGLSYTDFEYSDLKINKENITDKEELTVSLQVTNSGNRAGKEVVELYVTPRDGKIIRPVIELKGFKKILLQPGETKKIEFKLNKKAFAYWESKIHDWHIETGKYTIKVGSSVEKIKLSAEVTVSSTKKIPVKYGLNSTMGDIFANPDASVKLQEMLKQAAPSDIEQNDKDAAVSQEMMVAMMQSMPLRQLLSFVPGMTLEQIEQMIFVLNQP